MRQGLGWLAVIGSAALGVTPTVAARVPAVTAEVMLADASTVCGTPLCADIMGGSGDPIPSQTVNVPLAQLYLDHLGFQNFTPTIVFTPEGLYPATGVRSLPLDTSVAQGQQILNTTILGQLDGGHQVVVYGVSQSAVISSLEMEHLAEMGTGAPAAGDLSFVLVADEMNPDGGLLERFAPVTIPSMGIDFYGATPETTQYATTIYSAEYDGFADFPRYPINLLADINALLGIAYFHGPAYSTDTALSTAQLLPGSTDLPDGTEAATNTNYYMIPTEFLPLLEPVKSIPLVGQPLYDLLEPDTKILVYLGYGHVDTISDVTNSLGGWDYGPANEATPFGLLP